MSEKSAVFWLIGNNWPLQNAHVRGWLPPIGATIEAVKDPT